MAASIIWGLVLIVGVFNPNGRVFLYAVAAFAVVGALWALFLAQAPLKHPTLRAMERRLPGATSRLLASFAEQKPLIDAGPLKVTSETVTLFEPWGFQARFLDDLAWVHPTRQVTSYNGAAVQDVLLLTLRFFRDPPLQIAVRAEELEKLSAMFAVAWPQVVTGWSPEREKHWVRNRGTFGRDGRTL